MSEQEIIDGAPDPITLEDDAPAPPPPGGLARLEQAPQEARQELAQAHPQEINLSTGLLPQQGGAAGAAAGAIAQVQMQAMLAKQFPRNYELVRQKVWQACQDPEFAEKATYSFKRGPKQVSGPSVNLARELAKLYGNFRTGGYTVAEDERTRTVRCWAWDLEGNSQWEQDHTFSKVIQRRQEDGTTRWIEPDAQQLIELHNREVAKGVRNCILALIPKSLVLDAQGWCKERLRKQTQENPDGTREKLIRAFGRVGVSAAELSAYLGKDLAAVTEEAELNALRGLFNRLNQERTPWKDILAEKAQEAGLGGTNPDTALELRQRIQAMAASAGSGSGRRKKEQP